MNKKNQILSILLILFSIFSAESSIIQFYESSEGMTFLCMKDNKSKPLKVLTLQCGEAKSIGVPSNVEVNYEMLIGKKSHCFNFYEEHKYLLSDGDTLCVRTYKDGFAWKKNGSSKIELINPEHTWLQNWTDCYEGFFPKDQELKVGQRIGYPALVEYKNGIFGLLTESGITSEEAGVSMYALGNNSFDLKPDGPENGGWQVFIVGTLPVVVESTLVSDIAAPNKLDDTSWIEPGVASWVYWAYNHGSDDFNIIKKYIDLAYELKLPYVLIDAEWDRMKDGKTVEDAVEYAILRDVKPMIWYNSSIGWVDGAPTPKYRLNTPEDLEKEFAWCEEIGVKGVKIDFFSGDTNRNWKFMEELLEAGARHHLLVNFHGSPLPRGWQRTYPNFITTESVYGAEWYNNVPTFTDKAACHNATLPFTRNVIGSMDYTPCAFTDSQHPHITTHAHELALTALYESGIQHLADRPESFLDQPQEVKDYLTNLPTAWDNTILLGGYPGEYVVMARQKGDKWWISAINGTDAPVDLTDFDYSRLGIKDGNLNIQLFEDAKPGNPSKWQISTASTLPTTIHLQPRGGIVMVAAPSQVVRVVAGSRRGGAG
ncbi:MAG: glycoside hydrolase family 97 catalytic domain-containing protein, partial [Muribaculaceae bacterium]|nr:glycoside hydrolase family 97 catalytic domain-containing protein [Muribaculaceae bacterium]